MLATRLENAILQTRGLADDLVRMRKRIREGAYDPKLLAFCTQHGRGTWTLEDTYAFATLWSWVNTGKLWVANIPVGSKPCMDMHVDRNREALAHFPDEGFRAEVWCGLEDEDGMFYWDFDIGLTSYTSSGKGKCPCGCRNPEYVPQSKFFPPASAPLEIGSTKASRTLLHLLQSKKLARWPYEMDEITLGILTLDMNLGEAFEPDQGHRPKTRRTPKVSSDT